MLPTQDSPIKKESQVHHDRAGYWRLSKSALHGHNQKAPLKCTPLLIINIANLLGCCPVHRLMCKTKWECFPVPWVIPVMLRENRCPWDRILTSRALNGSSCEEKAGWVLSTCRGRWAWLGSRREPVLLHPHYPSLYRNRTGIRKVAVTHFFTGKMQLQGKGAEDFRGKISCSIFHKLNS